MKNLRLLFIILIFANITSSQKLTEPKLVGSWIGGEDFGEFIFHKTEELNYYLQESPNGKIIAGLCSKDKLSLALVGSSGFAFNFPEYTQIIKVPSNKVFFARFSKCAAKSEQYWFVPENSKFDYDEIILAEKVKVNRWIGNYYENPVSKEAEQEFEDNLKKFIEQLKNDSKAEGFIIRNNKMLVQKFNKAIREIRKEKSLLSRIQYIRKRIYTKYYPEFMTVTINN